MQQTYLSRPNLLLDTPRKNKKTKLKDPEKLLAAINTMLYSWGSDPYAEVLWTMTEICEWVNDEYQVNFPILTEEMHEDGEKFHETKEEWEKLVRGLA